MALWDLPELGKDGTYPHYHGDSKRPKLIGGSTNTFD